MAKVCKSVDPSQPGTLKQHPETDWTKYVLRLEESSEVLRCPAKSKCITQGSGYKTTNELLVGFERIGCLPLSVNVSRLNDGSGLEETLKRNEAKWNDSCRLLYNSAKLKRTEKRKKSQEEANDDDTGSLQKSTRKSKKRASIETYFFCDKPAPDGESLTRKASTFGLDMNVRKAAMKLQEKSPLAKLSAGDLIAQNAQYHLKYLNSLYNRAREKKSSEDSDKDRMNHGLAFAELISYIEETCMDTSVTSIFKLSDLVTLYTTRLEQLGSNVVGRVHSTGLKKRILAYFLDMKPHKQGRDIILVSNECVGHALRKACEHDIDDEDVHLARAA